MGDNIIWKVVKAVLYFVFVFILFDTICCLLLNIASYSTFKKLVPEIGFWDYIVYGMTRYKTQGFHKAMARHNSKGKIKEVIDQ